MRRLCWTLMLFLLSGAASAQGFSALVSPPRFEGKVQPGETYRNVVEITNVSDQTSTLSVHTADWTLDAQGGAVFSDALAPGSCRPWVGIEAPTIQMQPQGKRRYRFEVAVPAGTPAGQCRFALMIEGEPQAVPGSAAPPVSGRIGVIVYLTLGDAKAQLQVAGAGRQVVEGSELPVLQVRNAGNAHGRPAGFLEGVGADGRKLVFVPSGLPVLPGETRAIVLTPQADDPDSPAPKVAFPVRVTGRLEWDDGRLDLDQRIP
jgi:fimbrial chaperone protein